MAGVDLPQALLNVWHLKDDDLCNAVMTGELGDLDVSSLLKWYVGLFKDNEEDDQRRREVPSLKLLALDGIVQWLNSSEDLDNDVRSILQGLNESTFSDLLLRPSMRYPILRACLEAAGNAPTEGRSLIDIDDAVLANEDYLRGQRDNDYADAYLLTLEDFWGVLQVFQHEAGMRVVTRTGLSTGGIEFFDKKRETQVRLRTSTVDTAMVLSGGILQQLEDIDWTNTMVAGDFLIQVLMDREETFELFTDKSPIDLFLYGLNVDEANKKIEEIYNVWARNPATQDQERLVIKNATHISFVAESRNRPVRIRLKLFKSATEALLDTNPSSLAFNGSQLMMLPRCARALETGHITMTMGNLSGHLSADRADFIDRLTGYLDLGFGLRLLPSYVETLQGRTLGIDGEKGLTRNLEKPGANSYLFARVNNPGWRFAVTYEEAFIEALDRSNYEQFIILQNAICSKLRIPVQRSGYANYLTRRIRLQVYGNDLISIQEKQITVPLAIAAEVESQIEWSVLSEGDQGQSWLIPVHDPSKHNPQTARLQSLPARNGNTNLRYWVITNQNLWAGQHPVLDELAEILWSIHGWFRDQFSMPEATFEDTSTSTSRTWLFWLLKYMRERLGPYPNTSSSEDHLRRKQGLPPLEEALQFRAFAFQDPPYHIDDQSSSNEGWSLV